MALDYEEFDLSQVQTYPLASRASKVRLADCARPHVPGRGVDEWVSRLPDLLAGRDFRAVVDAIDQARRQGRPVVWGLGAHVLKVGLSPVIIDLMQRGYVSALALNGAGLIHDFELAVGGSTSEDVDGSLGSGQFGMATETGRDLNTAIADGVARGQGIGQSVGAYLCDRQVPYLEYSLVGMAYRLGLPVTVHVALGTDIIHMHPSASGAALGEGSLRDFRYLASVVSHLAGGVYLNCGSAVVLPEVFLKAVAVARNAGHSLEGLTTVNLDFLRHYRPQTNVVTRPTAGTGRGYSLTGHHELMIPLLAAVLVERHEADGVR
jgi:hypothetical protein